MPALIRRVVDRALDAFCAATMAAIVLITLFQVINRYAIQHPVSWTGEIARFLAVWVVLLGAARCVRDDSHIYIDLLYNLVGRRAQWWMMLAVNLLFATLAGVMIWQGVKILPIVAKQTAAASRISTSLSKRACMGVMTRPGRTAFERMPRPANCMAIDRDRASTPAFDT